MLSVSLKLLLNKQFRDFFSFVLRIEKMKMRKEKKYKVGGKMKDEGVRARCYSFDVFLFFFYFSWNINWITKRGSLGNFYLLITFVLQRQLFFIEMC